MSVCSSRAVPVIAVLWCVAPAVVFAQDLIDSVDKADQLQRSLSIGEFTPRNVGITPCQPAKAFAFDETVDIPGVWAARLRLERPGTGNWTLVIQGNDGAPAETRAVGDGASPGTEWVAGPAHGTQVRIALNGPATATASCPLIRILSELQQLTKGKPRGLVLNDDRWADPSPQLTAAPDSQVLRGWSSAVAYVEILSGSTSLVPCTGFFISTHLMITAAHCISSKADATRARVLVGQRTVPGSALRLLIAQKIDFSVVWVEGNQSDVLRLGADAPQDLVVWQRPSITEKLISVVGCTFEKNDGARMQHRCDTTGGASGSPVQSRVTGDVVGVHILGCTDTNRTAQCVNAALRVSEIRAKLLQLEPKLRLVDSVAADELLRALTAR